MDPSHLSFLQEMTNDSSDLTTSEIAVLTVIFTRIIQSGTCYLSVETIGSKAKLSRRRTMALLSSLVTKGWIVQRDVRERSDVPKARGWYYVLAKGAIIAPLDGSIGAVIAPMRGQSLPPHDQPCAQGMETNNGLQFQSKEQYDSGMTGQPLPPSRSTTTSTLKGDRVGGGSTSRVSEATEDLPTPSKPSKSRRGRAGGEGVTMMADSAAPEQAFMARSAPPRALTEDETDRNALRGAIIAALPELDAQLLHSAMCQNRHHLQAILDAFKLDVSCASSWAADKAQDLLHRCQAKGRRLLEPAVSKLLADDAEVDAARWMSGSLKPRAAQQVPAAVEAEPAIEESYEREPEQLVEVVAQALSGVRRVPQPAQQERPDWWWGLVGQLSLVGGQRDAGLQPSDDLASALMLVQIVLGQARVEVRDGVAWVSPGGIIPSEVGHVAAHAESWGRVLSWHARRLGLVKRVQWALKPDGTPAEPVKVEVVEEEPKATPVVHGPRPASARPAWWAELLVYLTARAGRAQHQEGDPALAGWLKALGPLLKGAHSARLCGDELVLELDSLGALRAVWADVEPHLARGVGLYADLPQAPRVVVHELGGEGVAP